MTIKWVQADPLVMNGEPFCYGSRVTVRQLLEMRRSGLTLVEILARHPELRKMGVASAWTFAVEHPALYADFILPDGSLAGPGLTEADAAGLPERLRAPGVVVTPA